MIQLFKIQRYKRHHPIMQLLYITLKKQKLKLINLYLRLLPIEAKNRSARKKYIKSVSIKSSKFKIFNQNQKEIYLKIKNFPTFTYISMKAKEKKIDKNLLMLI